MTLRSVVNVDTKEEAAPAMIEDSVEETDGVANLDTVVVVERVQAVVGTEEGEKPTVAAGNARQEVELVGAVSVVEAAAVIEVERYGGIDVGEPVFLEWEVVRKRR